MNSSVEFSITFHSPFRVSTGHASGGVDATIDPENPLPNTSLKGVMRATARQLLGQRCPVINEVFGSSRYETPWRWSHATAEAGWHEPTPAARVAIDDETHTARPDMLAVAEQTGAEQASFRITQRGHPETRDLRTHRLVLAIAGEATRSLGADRRRGLGWVSIRCTNVDVDESAVREFLALGQ